MRASVLAGAIVLVLLFLSQLPGLGPRPDGLERGRGSRAETGINHLELRRWQPGAVPWRLEAGSAAVQRRPLLVFGIRGVNEFVMRSVELEVREGSPVVPPLFELAPFPGLPIRCRTFVASLDGVLRFSARAATFRAGRIEARGCTLELPSRDITIRADRATWLETEQAVVFPDLYLASSPKGTARGRGLTVSRNGTFQAARS